MGDDDEDYSKFPEFSDALRKLGWLSTYSRQVLLTRHMLRTFQDEDVVEEMLWRGRDQTALDCFRLAITVFSGLNIAMKQFSAPYEPQDRPDTYHLAYSRKRRVFSQSEISGLSSFEFHTLGGGGFGFDNSSPYALEDMQLIEEINTVAKGVTLSTKAVGDKRAKQLITRSLWLNDRVYDWVNYEKFFNEWLPHTPRASDFWRRWMRGVYDGEPLNWNLQLEVAKIDEAIWEEGVEAVAAEIEKIEAKSLVQKLPQIEDVFETETGLYDVSSSTVELSDLINSISHRVEFACKLALESNTCDFDDFSTAAKLLRYALENCADDPNAYEQFLRQARFLISDGLARGDFSHHDTLDVLIGTLDEAGLQLRADHPEIASAVKSRSEQAVREMSEAKRLVGAGLIEDLRNEGTTGRLDTEMSLAAETVRDGSSEEATASALKRTGNQAGKISLAERAKNAEGSGQMAAVKIGMRAQSVVEYVLSIIGGGAG